MPQTVRLNMKIGSLDLPSVGFAFGVVPSDPSRRRMVRDGQHFAVEIPAVLDILAAIEAGTVPAARARTVLQRAIAVAYDECDGFAHESRADKDTLCQDNQDACPGCTTARADFDAALAASLRHWQLAQRSDEYPFAVGQRGLHTIDCPVTRRYIPEQYNQPVPGTAEYAQELRAVAHSRPHWGEDLYIDVADWAINFRPLTPEDARAWIAERTGPKGGRNYNRCRRCAPTP
ncbi:hypothetical protein [Kitasatospora sp. NPDC006786]|uniref:hypothetical protein n=1 Tax=unclassified Kitasatospora TaxID=2633591 RepID=UPI0033FB38BC